MEHAVNSCGDSLKREVPRVKMTNETGPLIITGTIIHYILVERKEQYVNMVFASVHREHEEVVWRQPSDNDVQAQVYLKYKDLDHPHHRVLVV